MTEEDGRQDDWLGAPMFFGGIGEMQTRAALTRADLEIVEWQVLEEDDGDGHTVRFLWLLAQRRA